MPMQGLLTFDSLVPQIQQIRLKRGCVPAQVDGVVVDVALQWCSDAYSDTLVGFANSVKTTDGGSHMDGLKSALTRSLNVMARKSKALKEGEPNLSGDNIREGLGGIIAVKVSLSCKLLALVQATKAPATRLFWVLSEVHWSVAPSLARWSHA